MGWNDRMNPLELKAYFPEVYADTYPKDAGHDKLMEAGFNSEEIADNWEDSELEIEEFIERLEALEGSAILAQDP